MFYKCSMCGMAAAWASSCVIWATSPCSSRCGALRPRSSSPTSSPPSSPSSPPPASPGLLAPASGWKIDVWGNTSLFFHCDQYPCSADETLVDHGGHARSMKWMAAWEENDDLVSFFLPYKLSGRNVVLAWGTEEQLVQWQPRTAVARCSRQTDSRVAVRSFLLGGLQRGLEASNGWQSDSAREGAGAARPWTGELPFRWRFLTGSTQLVLLGVWVDFVSVGTSSEAQTMNWCSGVGDGADQSIQPCAVWHQHRPRVRCGLWVVNGSFPPGTHLKVAYFPVGFRREGDVGFVNTASDTFVDWRSPERAKRLYLNFPYSRLCLMFLIQHVW